MFVVFVGGNVFFCFLLWVNLIVWIGLKKWLKRSERSEERDFIESFVCIS